MVSDLDARRNLRAPIQHLHRHRLHHHRSTPPIDRIRRYYSLQVIPEAPGGIHAKDCPCCRVRQRVEEGCRQAVGMHGAGLSRKTIERQLGRWLDRHSVACVMQFVDGALGGAPLTHHWNGGAT